MFLFCVRCVNSNFVAYNKLKFLKNVTISHNLNIIINIIQLFETIMNTQNKSKKQIFLGAK